MSELIAPKWYEVYGAYWKPLSETQKQAWGYELLEGPSKVRNCSPEMVSNALRRLAKKTDRDGRAVTPGLQQVRDELFAIMRERKQELKTDLTLPECADCKGTGFYTGTRWLCDASDTSKIVGLCVDPTTCGEGCPHRDEPVRCYDIAIPCECQRGENILRTGGYKGQESIKRMQAMARESLRATRRA